jgi:hypothetical protein
VTDRPDEITIREAAELAGVKPKPEGTVRDPKTSPANVNGAEATASLDVMLAASRKGRIVRRPRL